MSGLNKIFFSAVFSLCLAEPAMAQEIDKECLVPDPPLSCIKIITGTPTPGSSGSILKEQMSIDMRIDRFNELKNPDFRLQEGLAY